MSDEQITETAEEARQAERRGLWTILLSSTALAAAGLILFFLFYAN